MLPGDYLSLLPPTLKTLKLRFSRRGNHIPFPLGLPSTLTSLSISQSDYRYTREIFSSLPRALTYFTFNQTRTCGIRKRPSFLFFTLFTRLVSLRRVSHQWFLFPLPAKNTSCSEMQCQCTQRRRTTPSEICSRVGTLFLQSCNR